MDRRGYRKSKALAAAVVGTSSALGVALGRPALVLIGVLGAMTVMLLVKRRTNDVLQDEMTADMAMRASHVTFIALLPAFGVAGAALLALTDSGEDLNIVGATLSWVTLAMLCAYLALFHLDNRRALADEE